MSQGSNQQEGENKNNTSGETLSLYFYVNVLVRKGPHLGSCKKKKKVLADLQVRAQKLSMQMEDLKEVK